MACRISELVLGCRDPEVLAWFWCEVLDFVVLDREEDGALRSGRRVRRPAADNHPQPKRRARAGKPRLHIDVNATDRDQDAELERLLSSGRARPTSARPGKSPGTSWPIPKATSSACSRPASLHCDGPRRQRGSTRVVVIVK